MWEESYQAIRDDERNGDSERAQELRENYRLEVEPVTELSGDCSGLRDNCTELSGDCTRLEDEPVQEMHDINVETTYERAEREAMMADEVQADYEREDKMGMI